MRIARVSVSVDPFFHWSVHPNGSGTLPCPDRVVTDLNNCELNILPFVIQIRLLTSLYRVHSRKPSREILSRSSVGHTGSGHWPQD